MHKTNKQPGLAQRFLRWLFGSEFTVLPREFGDPVPPDLREFENKAKEAQHHALGHAPQSKHPSQRR